MVKNLKNGKAPSNIQTLNKALSSIIPPSNSHFSRCIASFCRLVLNIKKLEEQHWQNSPSAEQLQHANNLPLTITSHPIQSRIKLSPVKPHVLHGISLDCRELFLADLKAANFPHPTFAWHEPWDSHWNQLFSAFLLKHWNHCYKYGAFANFPFNSKHNNSVNSMAVLKRWFVGKSNDIRKNKYSPVSVMKKAIQVKKSKWRKQTDIFSEPTCCSDTEQTDDGNFHRVQCPWRSTLFTELAYHLDKFFEKNKAEKLGKKYYTNTTSIWLLRQTSELREKIINVPSGLPRNCYHPNFLASLNETDINVLRIKDKIDLQAIIKEVSTQRYTQPDTIKEVSLLQ
ncbi:uncharacterized protein PGTG_11637 [Puccinia graminis f. sp. tritici CRL 75-36-700-3]|uniref:Uncharacterized protein n=1 Tax=Puccinia graminis f. sp. tritici (strain CRL 75-36-700-3 / race SCCL) TaxID=418459 RepID=E3KNK6_PUCGT|nr:uncharacterized protein PGTG_11637 [Puccinia graminis f. sp. tritici CRL 75-36-700-3]EFP85881.1 hypothetical protein PGTG_11637 [Puccinia graminis f. sp. tritici CRL 75-36-700-3]